jgi:antitoxin component of MazEF toxin-antitoxin module
LPNRPEKQTTTEVIGIGEELGVILPPKALDHLNVALGDAVYITLRNNSIYLSSTDPEAVDTQPPAIQGGV